MLFLSLLLLHFELEFNSNVFETNIFNIFIVIGLLYYIYKVSYRFSLEAKQKEIFKIVENSEKNLFQSINYYLLAQKLYQQFFLLFTNNNQTIKEKKIFLINEKSQKLKEIIKDKINSSKKLLIKKKINKLVLTKQYLLYLVLSKIIKKYLFENSSFKNNLLISILKNQTN